LGNGYKERGRPPRSTTNSTEPQKPISNHHLRSTTIRLKMSDFEGNKSNNDRPYFMTTTGLHLVDCSAPDNLPSEAHGPEIVSCPGAFPSGPMSTQCPGWMRWPETCNRWVKAKEPSKWCSVCRGAGRVPNGESPSANHGVQAETASSTHQYEENDVRHEYTLPE